MYWVNSSVYKTLNKKWKGENMKKVKIIACLLMIGTGLVGCNASSNNKESSKQDQKIEVETNPASIHVDAAK